MYRNKRFKFLKLIRRLLNIKACCVPPKWYKFIYYVLFPLNWFYEKQTGIYYDPMRDIYWINDVKYSGDIFRFFNDPSNKGKLFRFNKISGGLVEIEEIYEK
jgi:hypothetical protein